MIRKKYLILTAMLSLLCINKTYAACTQEEINEFKKIEDEYKITYEFNLSTKDYTVTFNGINIQKYEYHFDTKLNLKNYVSSTENSVTFSNIKPGEYANEIYGTTKECNSLLKKINLKLAKYNKYYGNPLCEGIEEFVLCQPTYDKEIDKETFESRVNTYKKMKNDNQETPNVETEENEILSYIKDNLVQIIIVTIFVILVIITTIVTAKSIKKSRRLE